MHHSTRTVRTAALALAAILSATLPAHGDCPADLNDDGTVDGRDLADILANWDLPGPTDLNDDGTTDANDLTEVVATWGCTTLPPMVFVASKTAFHVDQQTLVRFQVMVPPVIVDDLLSLAMMPVDENGNITGEPFAFPVDDGSLNAGDDIANDGVFSARIFMYTLFPEVLRYRIFASVGSSAQFSNVLELHAVPKISPAQGEAAVETQQAAQDSWEENRKALGDTPAARAATVAALLADPDVKDAGVSPDGTSIYINYTSGIRGGLMLNPEGYRGAPPRRKSRAQPIPPGEESLPARFPIPASPLPLALAGTDGSVGSDRVLVWDAYNHAFAPNDEGPFLRDLFQNSECPKFDVTYLKDDQCTVASVEDFTNYGTICMITHGKRDQDDQVMFLTYEEATAEAIQAYSVELSAGRIAVSGAYFAVGPGKIYSLPGAFARTVIYNGSCFSASNTTLQEAFISGGAGAYLGFSDKVTSSYARTAAEQFFTAMVTDGDTAPDAWTSVTPSADPVTPFAAFMLGGPEGTAYSSDFRNGSFDQGLDSWDVAGDGRYLAMLAEHRPTEGLLMGIVSTGLGFTTSEGSLSQTFCVSPEADRLEFDWNFISEEFIEWCGPKFPYNDPFEVTITSPSGTLTVFYQDVDGLCGSVSPTGASFDQGDAYATGWRTASVDISGIAAGANGAPITVTFRVYDLEDSIYDTAVLLDRIQVVNLP